MSTTELLYYFHNPYLISPRSILQDRLSFLFQNLELKGSIDDITAAGLFPVVERITIIPVATRAFSTSPYLLSNVLVSLKRRIACSVPAVLGGGPPFYLSGDNTGSISLTFPEALPSWMFSTFSFSSHSVSLRRSALEGWCQCRY